MWAHRLARAFVGCHGVTDILEQPPRLVAAAYVAASMLPAWSVSPLFWTSSCVHLARDVGPAASAAGHALLCILRALGREPLAACSMMVYMAAYHVPRHLRACHDRHGMLALALPCAVGVGLYGAPESVTSIYGALARRVIIGHTACGALPGPASPGTERPAA